MDVLTPQVDQKYMALSQRNWSLLVPSYVNLFHSRLIVESCISRIGGIKYLLKSIWKLFDRALIRIVGEHRPYDEISSFEKVWYVSASEDVWGLL